MISVFSVFAGSLFGIIFLLSFKAWETRRERIIGATVRGRLDLFAMALKRQVDSFEQFLMRLPSFSGLVVLQILAFMSVKFAHWARAASEAAHRLADFISHKHNFERKELRSEFLKTMIEHKNGLAQPILNAVKKRRTKKSAPATEPKVTTPEVQSE